MKHKALLFILIYICASSANVFARDTELRDSLRAVRDSILAERKAAEEGRIKVWTVGQNIGNIIPAKADTAKMNFHQNSTDAAYGIANAWCGNMGSPMQSKLFFGRGKKSDFLFAQPYDNYIQTAENIKFFNTKTPYTNISYHSAGPSYGKEERLKASFAVNVSPNTSFGFNADYIYGRGMYIAQSTNDILGNFWVSHQGKHYWAHGIVALNHFKNYENGGIKNDSVVTHPELMPTRIKAENMEVNIAAQKKATSRLKNQYILYTHKYRTGKETLNTDDSTEVFVPIINFVHTLKYEHDQKRYTENDTTAFYGTAPMLNDSITRDKAGFHTIRNLFGVELTEEFNAKAKFGLTAYIAHDLSKYQFFRDLNFGNEKENTLSVGGIWSKNAGKHLSYNAQGEVAIAGANVGEFSVSGEILTHFEVGTKRINLSALAKIENERPDFFIRHYESNYFKWDNGDFGNTTTAHVEGHFEMPDWKLSFGCEFENIKKYIYFDRTALPQQYDKNLPVLALTLKKDFSFWLFHLENEVSYQESGNQNVLPLPRFACYHNLYLTAKLFKVLTIQIGGDVHYHTSYKAQSYMPATGMFYNTDKKIGNYPIASVYGAFHLKRFRFYAMYYHMNYKFSNNQYFSMPSYPIYPGVLKIGISWNFYD